jgi:hypothetical protein
VLFAFITAIPVKIRVKDKEVEMAEVNFLCVRREGERGREMEKDGEREEERERDKRQRHTQRIRK